MGATDARRLVPILNEVLPAFQGQSFTVTGCQAELVDYGRQRRATLRYHVTGQPATNAEPQEVLVYGKLTGDGSGAQAGAVSEALRQRIAQAGPRGQFTVPRVLAWREELQTAAPGAAELAEVQAGPDRGRAHDARRGACITLISLLSRYIVTYLFSVSIGISAVSRLDRSRSWYGTRNSIT
jgi:hypothetical protein